MNKKKLLSGAVAIIAVMALFLTGTFAWYETAVKVNVFSNTFTVDALLHDDFDGENKDVYVENTGETNLYVRISLGEYLNLVSSETPVDPVYETYTMEDSDSIYSNYFQWEMGGQKYYMPGLEEDTTVYDGSEQDVQQTPLAQVITMAEYMVKSDDDKDSFIGWIYDTDGYAYWSQPLEGGEATGLLLDAVYTNSSITNYEQYYYAIEVTLEAVNASDIYMWTQGAESIDGSGQIYEKATTDAAELLLGLTDHVKITDTMSGSDASANDYDSDGDGWLTVIEYDSYVSANVIEYAQVDDVIEIGGIEWIVLTVDEETRTKELLSLYILEVRSFHDTSGVDYTGWEYTDMYTYLNGDFYNNLDDELKDMIVTVQKSTETGAGNSTLQISSNLVYLLSSDELSTIATKYYAAQYIDGTTDLDGWWLRSPSSIISTQVEYSTIGGIGVGYMLMAKENGVRPSVTIAY